MRNKKKKYEVSRKYVDKRDFGKERG